MRKKVLLLVLLLLLCLCGCSSRNDTVSITVSFVTNGGTAVSKVEDKTIAETPVSTRSGFILDGWYEDKELKTRVNFPFKAGSSCTLYAKWMSKETGNEELVFQANSDGTEYYVIGCSSYCDTVWIPDTYKSRPVTTLNAGFLTVKNYIKHLHIGKNVKTISETFSRCTMLTDFETDEENTYFSVQNDVLFSVDRATLIAYPVAKKDTSYVIPETVCELSKNAFARTAYLQELTIGKNVVSSYRALQGIDSLQSFSVNNNPLYKAQNGILYSSNGDTLYAFPCSYSESVFSIPSGVKTISEGAFDGSKIQKISFSREVEFFPIIENAVCLTEIECEEGGTYRSVDGVLFCDDGKTLYLCPQGKTGSYSVPEGVTTIGDFSCNGCSVSDIVLPASVRTVEKFAFCDATNLCKIIFSKNSQIEFISESALIRCSKLSYVAFTGRKPPETGSALFDACSQDLTVSVPSNTVELYRASWKFASPFIEGKGDSVTEYTVTFDACGGEEVESVTGTGIAEMPTTTRVSQNDDREQFVLLGWYKNPQGTGEKIEFPYAIEEDITLYAAWEKTYK